jgi:hypothetical protein
MTHRFADFRWSRFHLKYLVIRAGFDPNPFAAAIAIDYAHFDPVFAQTHGQSVATRKFLDVYAAALEKTELDPWP